MPRNISLFIAFRLLFNARFYYPVFAVIQLDYGLTMEQFALLNAVWALAIIVLEVPSGALADKIGRKRMVVVASVLMVLEMATIAFVPLGNPTLVFAAWVVNRILSGAAEAAASGADEALAYESLPEANRDVLWPSVLQRLMKGSSFAFMVAMLVGAAVYDPDLLNRVAAWLGLDGRLSKVQAMRLPVILTLVSALAVVGISLAMKEPAATGESSETPAVGLWRAIFQTASWIGRTPKVLAMILGVLVFDSLVRLLITAGSQYYRLIDLPEASFGVIGASLAGMGVFVAKLAKWLVDNRTLGRNSLFLAGMILLGFVGATFAIPLWGVLVMIPLRVAMGCLQFFSSHYLNALVESKHRSTVLSFRGLALNLGFGALSLCYGFLLRGLGGGEAPFRESLYAFPLAFVVMFVVLVVYYRRYVLDGDRLNVSAA